MTAAAKDAATKRLRVALERVQVQLRRAEAWRQAARRRRETRQKVLVGAVVLALMDVDPALRQRIERELDVRLTRVVDRRVFAFLAGARTDAKETP